MAEMAEFLPDWTLPPGRSISRILARREISPDELAEKMGRPRLFVKMLISGSIEIDTSIANILEAELGSTAQFWINRERLYRTDLARIGAHSHGSSIADWLRRLPLADMTKFGWINTGKSTDEKASACLAFFGVKDLDEWQEVYSSTISVASFRTSPTIEANPFAVSAWLRWAELQALKVECAPWNPDLFRQSLLEIRKLTRQKDPKLFLVKMKELCASSGVSLVVAKSPRGCRASGATWFLKGDKAIVVLSFRHLTDDHFWFTFFHEAAHLLFHARDALFLEDGSDVTAVEESEADKFAGDLLIPTALRPEMLQLRPRMEEIVRFSVKAGISPGIVVGQLQHFGRIRRDQWNNLKRRYVWDAATLNPINL